MRARGERNAILSELVLSGVPYDLALRFVRAGASAPQALEAIREGIPVHKYVAARKTGVTHTETVLAWLLSDREPKTFARYLTRRELGRSRGDSLRCINSYFSVFADIDPGVLIGLHRDGITLEQYALVLVHQIDADEFLTAAAAGVDQGWYVVARLVGVSHDEVMEAEQLHIPFSEYVAARCLDGAPGKGLCHTETVDLFNQGYLVDFYSATRQSGLTHEEVVALIAENVQLRDYMLLVHSGRTYEQVLEARRAGMNLHAYLRGARLQVAHDDLLGAHRAGMNLEWYLYAAGQRIPHRAIMDMEALQVSYQDLLDIANHRIGATAYVRARRAGATHAEIVEARTRKVNVASYAVARREGRSHEKAISWCRQRHR